MSLSRREFLRLLGISTAGSVLPALVPAATGDANPGLPIPSETACGRTLDVVALHAAAGVRAPVRARLWADTQVTILEARGDWYRLPEGYARRDVIQPMLPYTADRLLDALPFPIEVSACYAAVRAYGAPEAPLTARVGHGGVLFAVDRLDDWVCVAGEDGVRMGWSQTAHWRQAAEDDGGGRRDLLVDRKAYRLTALHDGRPVLAAAFAAGARLAAGDYGLRRKGIGGRRVSAAGQLYDGSPPYADFAGVVVGGAYWHNRFGSDVPGDGVQVPTPLARWLYGWLTADSRLMVR